MTGIILSWTPWATRHFQGALVQVKMPRRRRTVREGDIPVVGMLIADVQQTDPGMFNVLLVAEAN